MDDAIRVIFIIPPNCEDESQTSQIMQDTYKFCKQNVKKTLWLLEQDFESLQLSKTDILVFEKFAGDIFERAAKTKAVIVGAPCLLTCLTNSKPIPNVDWPVYSLVMEGCIVVPSALKKPERDKVMEMVQFMGAHYSAKLVTLTTHLITDSVRSNKYHAAVQKGIKIMLPSFIDSVWEANLKGNVDIHSDQFEVYKCPVFHKLVVSSTGFSTAEQKDMDELIRTHGGRYTKKLALQETDVLICNGSTSEKYKACIKHKIDCVTINWLKDSAKAGYAIPDMAKYAVKVKTSTPTKLGEEEVGPNFSMMSSISTLHSLHGRSVLQETIDASSVANYAGISAAPLREKRKGSSTVDEQMCAIDIKRAKRAGPFLDGCSVYLIGFSIEQHEKLCKILNFSGATRYDTLSERVTHIVVGDARCSELKAIQTKTIHGIVVSLQWLIDSMEAGQPSSEDNYRIGVMTSPSADQGSPLSKKGLRLLKTNVSMIDEERSLKVPDIPPMGTEEDDLMRHYLQHGGGSEVDSLAAALAAGQFDTNQHLPQNNPQENPNCTESLPSITMSDSSIRNESVRPSQGAAKANEHTMAQTAEDVFVEDDDTTVVPAIFEGLTFLLIIDSSSDEDSVKICIEEMGGKIVPKTYTGMVDYGVVSLFSDYQKLNATTIVNNFWILQCFEEKAVVDVTYFHRPFSVENETCMEGCVIAVSGYSGAEKKVLCELCVHMGACVQDSLSRVERVEKTLKMSTHLVSAQCSGKKYTAAINWNLPVVGRRWVLDCLKNGRKMEERLYQLTDDDASGLNLETPVSCAAPVNNSIDVSSNKINAGDDGRVRKNLFGGKNTPMTPVERIRRESGVGTPGSSFIPTCSQVTPVSKIMQQAGFEPDLEPSPVPIPFVKTPNSPLGRFAYPNPSPGTRKMFQQMFDYMPDTGRRERRLSTPLSELKNRLWRKVGFYKEDEPKYDDEFKSPTATPLNSDVEMAEENVQTPAARDSSSGSSELSQQLQNLQSMLQASSSKNRRSSVGGSSKKWEPEAPVEDSEKNSQALDVGWDWNSASKENKSCVRLFMISGLDVDDRNLLVDDIEALGATVSDLQNFDPSATHIITNKASRNEKLLASMAAGLWVMHPSYITACKQTGKFLDEEEFEFGNPRFRNVQPMNKDSEQRARCCHYWRKEISRRGYGAFYDVKAIVVANKKESLMRVIEAGGGIVLNAQPPFDEKIYATHCLLETKSVSSFNDYILLAKQGIFCVTTLYVSDFLSRTCTDIKDSIVPCLAKYY